MAEPSKSGQKSTSGSPVGDEEKASSKAAARLPWLLVGWGVSSALLIAAIVVLLVTDLALLGVVLFVLGAIGTAVVSIGLLRTRAQVRRPGS